MTLVASTSGVDFVSTRPAQFVMRWWRPTRAEMTADASVLMAPMLAQLVTCWCRRTRVEMDAAASSSGAHLMIPGSAPLDTGHPRRTKIQGCFACHTSAKANSCSSNNINNADCCCRSISWSCLYGTWT